MSHSDKVDSLPSIAYKNAEGEDLPYEYNVVNLTSKQEVGEV